MVDISVAGESMQSKSLTGDFKTAKLPCIVMLKPVQLGVTWFSEKWCLIIAHRKFFLFCSTNNNGLSTDSGIFLGKVQYDLMKRFYKYFD